MLVIKGTGLNALQPAADDSLKLLQRHAASRCDPLRLDMCGSKRGGERGAASFKRGFKPKKHWPERPDYKASGRHSGLAGPTRYARLDVRDTGLDALDERD